MSAVYLQQFPSYSNHNCKKSSFLRTPAFIFCLPWGRPCGNHAKRCMNKKTIQFLPNPSQHIPIYLEQFPIYSNHKCKKSSFSRTAAHIFVSPGDAHAIITQYIAWMETGKTIQRLSNPSQHVPIYLQQFPSYRYSNRKCKKIAVFTYGSPHFCFPWRRPCDYHAVCCMDGTKTLDKNFYLRSLGWKDNSMLAKPLAVELS